MNNGVRLHALISDSPNCNPFRNVCRHKLIFLMKSIFVNFYNNYNTHIKSLRNIQSYLTHNIPNFLSHQEVLQTCKY